MLSPAKQLLLGDFDHEMAATRRILERVPEAHFAWRPHPKSFPAGSLAMHVANLPHWMVVTLTADAYDLAAAERIAPPATSADVLAHFDAKVAAVQEAWAAADEGILGDPWTLRFGDHVVFTMPRSAVLRSGLNHLMHHRAQLTVYLRLLDVPVPGLYGPSADDKAG